MVVYYSTGFVFVFALLIVFAFVCCCSMTLVLYCIGTLQLGDCIRFFFVCMFELSVWSRGSGWTNIHDNCTVVLRQNFSWALYTHHVSNDVLQCTCVHLPSALQVDLNLLPIYRHWRKVRNYHRPCFYLH